MKATVSDDIRRAVARAYALAECRVHGALYTDHFHKLGLISDCERAAFESGELRGTYEEDSTFHHLYWVLQMDYPAPSGSHWGMSTTTGYPELFKAHGK